MLSRAVCVLAAVGLALAVAQDFESMRDLRAAFSSEIQLGIDLGTTLSVAALCVRGNVSVVRVDGSPLVPSAVFFPLDGDGDADAEWRPLVGQAALMRRALGGGDSGSVLYAAKRAMGRRLSELDGDTQRGLPAELSADADGMAEFRVPVSRRVRGARVSVPPEGVGALVLQRLKSAAEASPALDWLRRGMGFRFRSVTVTVPVTFDADARAATTRACRLAGFRQVRIVEEPVAAALAYGLGAARDDAAARNAAGAPSAGSGSRVLVFDLGGGTLDVALLHFNADARSFFVDATDGDARLGGEDFDAALAEFALRRATAQGADAAAADAVRASPSAWQRLLRAAELAKRELSDDLRATVCIPYANAGAAAEAGVEKGGAACAQRVSVSREDFRDAAQELFARAVEAVRRVLRDAHVPEDARLDVVLVGGSSRMPGVREDMARLLPNATLHFDGVDPDQAVAIGAARSFGCNAP